MRKTKVEKARRGRCEEGGGVGEGRAVVVDVVEVVSVVVVAGVVVVGLSP